MLADINFAIEHAQMLKIWYFPGWRIVAPHTLGKGANGQLLLRVYQHAGDTASGSQVGWKLFRVDRIAACELLDKPSGPISNGYRRSDKAMKLGVIAER